MIGVVPAMGRSLQNRVVARQAGGDRVCRCRPAETAAMQISWQLKVAQIDRELLSLLE
jgi:hypothetical protein